MTAVAAYSQQYHLSSPFAFSTPSRPSPPSNQATSNVRDGKSLSGNAIVGQKRVLTPRPSLSRGGDRTVPREGEEVVLRGEASAIQPPAWLRRVSSTMSTSRDSSQPPPSRPTSAAVSHSNGSLAFSHAGSTTPMFPHNAPRPVSRNKLVKRTASLHSANGSPLLSSGSRLPMPVFRRPATSHQRSATLQDRLSTGDISDHSSTEEPSVDTRDPSMRHYFTSSPFENETPFTRGRGSTRIPNPIKRVYPDRRYIPVLVSANEVMRTEPAGGNGGLGIEDEGSAFATTPTALQDVASSPPPNTSRSSEMSHHLPPRRSFSLDHFDPTKSRPLWRRRSSPNRGQPSSSNKLVRRSRNRVVSAPYTSVGSSATGEAGSDSERPTKRRDLTDPRIAPRSIYSSSGSTHAELAEGEGDRENEVNMGSQMSQGASFVQNSSPFGENPAHALTPSPLERRRVPSTGLYSTTARPNRASAAHSEITSTVGSDSEMSVGDISTDYHSDTVYDSYPTRTTRSSSGKRGPHIESIFDESPPQFSSGRSTRLTDLLYDSTYNDADRTTRYRHSTIEEEESILSTPVRSLRDNSVTSTPSARPGAQQPFQSSPPSMPAMLDPEEIDWDAPDGAADSALGTSSDSSRHRIHRGLQIRFGPALPEALSDAVATPQRQNGADRAKLYEWSETLPNSSHKNSPPRPKTVHGKKDPESRGSRSAGRRAPSVMHARSHSVPVNAAVEGQRANPLVNKFGTWGVGSKPATEDWNEDFDFDDTPEQTSDNSEQDENWSSVRPVMVVPKSIREQQENVVANIGLLKEWGLLIEELKELRVRAVALGMMIGPYAQDWQEVDAMIELADQETEEETLQPRRSPPSSPGFDSSAFEEPMPNIASNALPRDSVHRPLELDLPESSAMGTGVNALDSTPSKLNAARPRKDSEAVARSVIEALQSKRNLSDATNLKPVPSSAKVPFDTATLRHIVPYVNGLKRKVKDGLRETEGLYSSPHRRGSPDFRSSQVREDGEPRFRRIFDSPESPRPSTSRRHDAVTDQDGTDDPMTDEPDDIAKRMEDMNLPH